jgi:hypothetical protein
VSRRGPDALVAGALGRCSLSGSGGVVVVTRFDCGSLRRLVAVRALHLFLGRRIRRQLPGLLATSTHTGVRARRILSITVFTRLEDLYGMGSVRAHVEAARTTARLGVTTSGGVFAYAGDWRRIMFDANESTPVLAGLTGRGRTPDGNRVAGPGPARARPGRRLTPPGTPG